MLSGSAFSVSFETSCRNAPFLIAHTHSARIVGIVERCGSRKKADMASYSGPATIVSPGGEIEVTVELRSRTDPDGGLTWGGLVDRGKRGELGTAVDGMSVYGLVLRFPDGREGNFVPSPPTTWSLFSVGVSGFMRV
jgi:hypothetical protein